MKLTSTQSAASAVLAQTLRGILIAPCGAGKTIIAINAAEQACCDTLVLVHTHDLAAQWGERTTDMSTDISRYSIVLMQSMIRDPNIGQRMRAYDLIIVDECHHVPCDTLTQILSYARGDACIWGLTATPTRSDGQDELITELIGPVIYSISNADMAAEGRIVRPRYMRVNVATGIIPQTRRCWSCYGRGCRACQMKGTRLDWADLISQLSASATRNNAVRDTVYMLRSEGHTVLVIGGLVAWCNAMAANIPGAVVASSKSTKRARAGAIEAMRSGEADVMFAATLADEGLDIPRISAVVLAMPSKSDRLVVQRAGRCARAYQGKPAPVVVDIVDTDIGFLIGMAGCRMAALEGLCDTHRY